MNPSTTSSEQKIGPAPHIEYVPGVCNIGPEEIARRRASGWTGLVIAIALFLVLFFTHVNPWYRLFIFFPAAMSASGFLQAHFHFCLGYAKKGIFNMGALGTVHNVTDTESLKKDKRKANLVIAYGLLIGLIVAIIVVFI